MGNHLSTRSGDFPGTSEKNDSRNSQTHAIPQSTVAYRCLSLDMGAAFGDANVPVSCWYPAEVKVTANGTENPPIKSVTYSHRISVHRIAKMLAGWEWVPEMISRSISLQPGITCLDGENMPLPASGPLVVLAHGFLGSRFDLSHLAEALAGAGFICFSPEYPESMAASYQQQEGLDRTAITNRLMHAIKNDFNLHATSYGIIGHSLGSRTAIETGDETWTRICIAGFEQKERTAGNIFFIFSMNDGAVPPSRDDDGKPVIPPDCTPLDEDSLDSLALLHSRVALVFDRSDAPNHISFLAESVNNAMISLLSPLLPVAHVFSIPMLDFDKYQLSRDSQATAKIVTPLVVRFLKEHMQMKD